MPQLTDEAMVENAVAARKARESAAKLVGQFRRIAGVGPAYEVLQIVNGTHARIQVVESGEEVDYPISDILLDPDADA